MARCVEKPGMIGPTHFVRLVRYLIGSMRTGPSLSAARDKERLNMNDMIDQIIRYENGEMEENEIVSFFQKLIDNGMAWTLQGHYGRTATALIEMGECK